MALLASLPPRDRLKRDVPADELGKRDGAGLLLSERSGPLKFHFLVSDPR